MSNQSRSPSEHSEAEPCPWCGEKPDTSRDEIFILTDGSKYGALHCCVTGPEVRTDYKEVAHWKADAIAAWNDRRATPAEAGERTLPELPHNRGYLDFEEVFFGDDMRAYGQQCARYAVEEYKRTHTDKGEPQK